MNSIKDIPYWMAVAHVPGWKTDRKNRLIIDVVHNNKSSLEEFFNSAGAWPGAYNLNEKETEELSAVARELPNYSFLAESMINQGYEIITLDSEEYPRVMKENLKASLCPPVIYIKGNKKIFNEKAIAIVGSRYASRKSLEFTDNIALSASKDFKVVVSGFARGVDKQALDSSIRYGGQSIIVLPQGIMTFGAGIKQYYKGIVEGDILVLSIFPPSMPWSVQAAMQRNVYIYGLAHEIFVAESGDSGGTWSGVTDGLRRGRKIFVRMPEEGEINSNLLLIEKGAVAVDDTGRVIDGQTGLETETGSIDIKILKLLDKGAELTSKQIIDLLSLGWPAQKLTSHLKKSGQIESVNSKPARFRLKNAGSQETLFPVE